MNRLFILSIVAGSAASSYAQTTYAQTTFAGPTTGYIFDSAGRSMRPIVGLPGGAYLGTPTSTEWDLASVAPNGKIALGVRGQFVELIPDMANPDSWTQLDQTVGTADSIKWSADSTGAVLFSSDTRRLQRITGLGTTPVIHTAVDLTTLGSAVSGWSVSPNGGSIALTTGAAGTASVYLLVGEAVSPVSIGSFGDPGAIAFSADGASVFVFDRAHANIVVLQISSGIIQRLIDTSVLVGAAGVQDMAAKTDGLLLYAAGQQSLCAWDTGTAQSAWCMPLEMTPISLQTLSVSPNTLLLNYQRKEDSPVWLLDTRTSEVYFVPSAGQSHANKHRSRAADASY